MGEAEVNAVSSSDSKGGWLYKERGAVCGPVSASLLIDKLYSGDLDEETQVSREFGEWQRLADVAEFETPLKRAKEALAKEQQRRAQRRAAIQIGLGRTALIVLCALCFGGVGYSGGGFLARERPWEDKTDWSKRPPPIVALPAKPVAIAAAVPKAPTPAAAPAGASHRNGATAKKEARPEPRRRRNSPRSSDRAAKGASKKTEPAAGAAAAGAEKAAPAETKVAKAAKAAPVEYNAAGLPRALTQKQIMKVLGTQKRGIANCLASEAKRNTDMPSTVTIEFVITAKGTAADFKVLERAVRDGPMADCLRTRVYTLRWPAFFGENKTVKIPFNIKRR